MAKHHRESEGIQGDYKGGVCRPLEVAKIYGPGSTSVSKLTLGSTGDDD